MHVAVQLAIGLVGGAALGLGIGRATAGTAQTPPAFVLAAPSAATAAAAPEAAAAAPAPAAAPASDPRPPADPAPAAAPAGDAAAAEGDPVIPARAGVDGAGAVDISLLVRGKGHFAFVDLETAQVTALTIRQGELQRDGAANFKTFAGRPKVGVLKGPRPRVELLHLGFDAEARPILAHIRTTGHAAGEVEGIIALKQAEIFIGLAPAPIADPVPAAAGRGLDAPPTPGEAPDSNDAQDPLPL